MFNTSFKYSKINLYCLINLVFWIYSFNSELHLGTVHTVSVCTWHGRITFCSKGGCTPKIRDTNGTSVFMCQISGKSTPLSPPPPPPNQNAPHTSMCRSPSNNQYIKQNFQNWLKWVISTSLSSKSSEMV